MAKETGSEVIAIVGGQWGDEGKGKIVDYFAQNADCVIRAQGGDNAGHTVVNEHGRFALHLIPAGIFNPGTLNIIGAGVALNLESLISEAKYLEDNGISTKNLVISPKAHLTFSYQLFLDEFFENLKGESKLGTTKRGIGPTYMDKAQRIGPRAGLLKDPDTLLKKLDSVLSEKRELVRHRNLVEMADKAKETLSKTAFGAAITRNKLQELVNITEKKLPDIFYPEYYEDLIKDSHGLFASSIIDTGEILQKHLEKGRIVIEGAHGTLLDLDHGTYPRVTSSSPTAAGLLLGAGIPPSCLTRAVGVFKSYATRVGEGSFPTEISGPQANLIRENGHEYGTTTGRPRRIGYFDGAAARYAHMINKFTDIALTRLDILNGMGELKICLGYISQKDFLNNFPADDEILGRCKPIYIEGFKSSWDELITIYCQYISRFFKGALLSFIGTGERREDLIIL